MAYLSCSAGLFLLSYNPHNKIKYFAETVEKYTSPQNIIVRFLKKIHCNDTNTEDALSHFFLITSLVCFSRSNKITHSNWIINQFIQKNSFIYEKMLFFRAWMVRATCIYKAIYCLHPSVRDNIFTKIIGNYIYSFDIITHVTFTTYYVVPPELQDETNNYVPSITEETLEQICPVKFPKLNNNDDITFSEEDTCCVCCEKIEKTQMLRKLPCEHIFHVVCCDNWLLNKKASCPLCRTSIIKPE